MKKFLVLLLLSFINAEDIDSEENYNIVSIKMLVNGRDDNYCVFESVKGGDMFSLQYIVETVGDGTGLQLPIEMILKNKNYILQSLSGVEGDFHDEKISSDIELEICINNLNYEDIVVDTVMLTKRNSQSNHTIMDELLEREHTYEYLDKMTFNLLEGEITIQAINSKLTVGINRAMALANMINTWSLIHIIIIMGVSISQAFVLQSFFSHH